MLHKGKPDRAFDASRLLVGDSMESDAIYFDRRAREERAAAAKSTSSGARQSHLVMAERYEELASALEINRWEMASGISR